VTARGSIEAKLSHEGRVAIGCFYLKLDHYAPGLKWFSKISKGIVGLYNSSINKVEVATNQPSL
jgi:hypothetical protein